MIVNIFVDIALQIVKRYPELGTGTVVGVLARKPEAFPETESNIIRRIINSGKHLYSLDVTISK